MRAANNNNKDKDTPYSNRLQPRHEQTDRRNKLINGIWCPPDELFGYVRDKMIPRFESKRRRWEAIEEEFELGTLTKSASSFTLGISE